MTANVVVIYLTVYGALNNGCPFCQVTSKLAKGLHLIKTEMISIQ
jgi:hypothetical protein